MLYITAFSNLLYAKPYSHTYIVYRFSWEDQNGGSLYTWEVGYRNQKVEVNDSVRYEQTFPFPKLEYSYKGNVSFLTQQVTAWHNPFFSLQPLLSIKFEAFQDQTFNDLFRMWPSKLGTAINFLPVFNELLIQLVIISSKTALREIQISVSLVTPENFYWRFRVTLVALWLCENLTEGKVIFTAQLVVGSGSGNGQ